VICLSRPQLDKIDPGDKHPDEQSFIKHRAQFLKPALAMRHSSIGAGTASLRTHQHRPGGRNQKVKDLRSSLSPHSDSDGARAPFLSRSKTPG